MEHDLQLFQHFAFNIWDFESARAVIDAAASLRQDVILQASAGIYRSLPAAPFSRFVKDYAAYKGIRAWLNIDHCKEKELLFHAVENGWDMIMADGSPLPLEENVSFVNEVAGYAHDHGVLVEAEIGQVKGVEDDAAVRQEKRTSRDEIARFLDSADIDFIAVAFGNAHGAYHAEPELHYELVEYTTSVTDKPFVVHGGSGLSDRALSRLIGIKGVGKLNISTELKQAYKRGMERAVELWDQPITAAKLIHDEIMRTAALKIKLLPSAGYRESVTGGNGL